MQKRSNFAKTMRNSFVRVQWAGRIVLQGNLIDDLKSPISGNGSVADNRFKSLTTMKLYVGNLSFDITERTLRELFEPYGTVFEVKLIMNRETGQSRGFGFVTMGNVSEGNAAIKGLHGKDKGGRKLTVNEARPKDDRGGHLSPGSRR
jgi:cold-inducible RNA-binding protein